MVIPSFLHSSGPGQLLFIFEMLLFSERMTYIASTGIHSPIMSFVPERMTSVASTGRYLVSSVSYRGFQVEKIDHLRSLRLCILFSFRVAFCKVLNYIIETALTLSHKKLDTGLQVVYTYNHNTI